MQRSNERSLKEVIMEMLETYKLDGKLNEVRLVNSWEKVMGTAIANHTKDIYVKKEKLIVKLDSAALRDELSYAKQKIIDMLNKEVGTEVISEVVFC